MKRWKCPQCDVGVLAPSKMNALDPRRFCLECSSEKGLKRLVARVCPSLEKKRKSKIETDKDKRKATTEARKRKKEKEIADNEKQPWERRKDKILAEFDMLKKLKCWKNNKQLKRASLDTIRWRADWYTTGHCKTGSNSIAITCGHKADKITIQRVLIHELAHAAAPPDAWHDHRWKSIYRGALEEFFGIRISHTGVKRLWEYEQKVEKEVREHLAGGNNEN